MYLTQALHRALQQTPHAPATIFGDRHRTCRELADRVARSPAGKVLKRELRMPYWKGMDRKIS